MNNETKRKTTLVTTLTGFDVATPGHHSPLYPKALMIDGVGANGPWAPNHFLFIDGILLCLG